MPTLSPAGETKLGDDPLSVDATWEFPELGDLGDDDIIADGGTQIMPREAGRELGDLGDDDVIADAGTQIMPRAPERVPASVAPAPMEPQIPPAPKTAPIHELDSDDVELELEEEQRPVVHTQPFDRSHDFSDPSSRGSQPTQQSPAWHHAPVARPDLALSPTPGPVASRPSIPLVAHHLPSVMINDPAPAVRPASIAPLAIDIAPARFTPDATLKLPPIRHARIPNPKKRTWLMTGAIAGGLALSAAAVIALVSFRSTDDTSASRAESTSTVAAKPREAEKGAVRSAVIETPETTPQKAAPLPGERDENGTPVFSANSLPSAPEGRESGPHAGPSAPSRGASASHAPPAGAAAPARATSSAPATRTSSAKATAPAAAPGTAPAPVAGPSPTAAPSPRPVSTTGTIEVPASVMTVMVDGDYKRVQNGRIVVTCGKHRVNAGRGTQVVDVPCGGVTSAM
jgi:hypothetical protein